MGGVRLPLLVLAALLAAAAPVAPAVPAACDVPLEDESVLLQTLAAVSSAEHPAGAGSSEALRPAAAAASAALPRQAPSIGSAPEAVPSTVGASAARGGAAVGGATVLHRQTSRGSRAPGGAARNATLGAGLPSKVYNNTSHRSRAHHVWNRNMMEPEKGPLRNLSRADWSDGDEGVNFFRAATAPQWSVFVAFCVLSVLSEQHALSKMQPGFQTHVKQILFWLVQAALFCLWILWSVNGEAAIEWTSGYFLEWMLSLDNLFVFHLIFRKYKTPSDHIRYGVVVGISGAILLRMLFFMAFSTLLHLFAWMRVPFGMLLMWSGIKAATEDDANDDGDLAELWVVRALKLCFGSCMSGEYGERPVLFQRGADGCTQATMLLVVVLCLEVTDVLFAADSCMAKIAQIPNQYIAFSSSMVAMFGIRAMFFVVEDLVGMFHLLPYGLCAILVFIGVQLVFSSYVHLAASTVCVLIFTIFGASVAGSWLSRPRDDEAKVSK